MQTQKNWPETPLADPKEQLVYELAQLEFTITAIDQLVMDAGELDWSADDLAGPLKTGREQYGYLRDVLASLERLVGERMTEYQQTVPGVGTLERHRNKSMTAWDKDSLLHAVLDTRLVDSATGEVLDETPLDKVLDVFNLPAPRTTRMHARGLEVDEFCQVTDNGGWKVAIR